MVSAFSAYGSVNVTYSTGSGSSIVAFQGLGSLGGAMSFSGYQGITPSGANVANYSSATNANFGLALSSFLYDGWQTVTLNNLTVGRTYAVQMFSLDNRIAAAEAEGDGRRVTKVVMSRSARRLMERVS